ncbi:MAG TPA: polysaccharide biosynthesis tyrosine autokinase [Kamptonema sp.]|nr:polysaccharide biosynthesis tyrosine autokinase [Kamptonema sp.]
METEHGEQVVSIGKRGRQFQELPVGDLDESSSPPQKGLNLRPFLRTFQRKILLIIGITTVVAVAAAVQIKLSKKTYQGDFRLLVEPVTNEARIVEPSTLARSEGGVPNRDIFSLDYPTQLEILQSPQMLSALTERIKTKYPKFTYEILKLNLLVIRVGSNMLDQTKIIEVRYLGQDPELVQFVLEETAKKYLKYSLDERKSRIGEGVKFIEDQLPGLQKRVNDLKSKLQQLQQQQRITDPRVQGEELLTQVRAIETQELETQRLLQEQRSLYANLQKQLDFTPNEAIAASALSEEPQYKELLVKVKEVESQIAVESARFKSANPYLEALERKRANLLDLLNQQTQRIVGQNLGVASNNSKVMRYQNSIRVGLIKQLVDTANQIQVLEVRSQAISQAKDDLNRQAKLFPAVAREYNELSQQLEIATKTRDQLLTQRETLRVQAAQNQVPWEVISKPRIPRDPSGNLTPAASKAKNKFIMAVGAGLGLGLLVALLVEKLRNIFYVADDIKDATQLPLLGVIPLDKSSEKLVRNTKNGYVSLQENDLINSSDSTFLEAFDSLYTNLCFLLSDRQISAVTVASAALGDGKSTVALYLAEVAALAGKRVLLVDANLHSPTLHSLLDLPNFKGLSDLLCNKLEANEIIQRSPVIDNLFVLTAGIPLSGAARRIGSGFMAHLMEEFQNKFDLVIYDTPPLVDAKDANFIAARTDGILMVVALHKTKPSVVKQVLNQLESFGIPCLGIVANYVGKNAKPRGAKEVVLTPTRQVGLSTAAPQD